MSAQAWVAIAGGTAIVVFTMAWLSVDIDTKGQRILSTILGCIALAGCAAVVSAGIMAMSTAANSASESYKAEALQSLKQIDLMQQAQEQYRKKHGHYTDKVLDLQLVDAQLSSLQSTDPIYAKIFLSSDQKSYRLEGQIDGSLYALTVSNGLVIDRSCSASGYACSNGRWESSER